MKRDTGVSFEDKQGLKYEVYIEAWHAKYPYEHTIVEVTAVPADRNSEAYQRIKAKLHDDWSLDISKCWWDILDEADAQVIQGMLDEIQN